MNRMLLLLGLLLLVPPPWLGAAEDCVPHSGCPMGKTPPKCCEKPRCEFWDELARARAAEQYFEQSLNQTAQDLFDVGIGEPTGADYDEFRTKVFKGLKELQAKFRRCPPSDRSTDVPELTVSEAGGCSIQGLVGGEWIDLSKDSALNLHEGCAEVIEAKYQAALNRQSVCFLNAGENNSWKYRMVDWGDEFKAERSELESDLERYWMACSIVFSAETARRVAKEGLDVLRSAPFDTPRNIRRKQAEQAARGG